MHLSTPVCNCSSGIPVSFYEASHELKASHVIMYYMRFSICCSGLTVILIFPPSTRILLVVCIGLHMKSTLSSVCMACACVTWSRVPFPCAMCGRLQVLTVCVCMQSPASCSGPSVTLELQPHECLLDEKTKKVTCKPAQLVLIKTPGKPRFLQPVGACCAAYCKWHGAKESSNAT